MYCKDENGLSESLNKGRIMKCHSRHTSKSASTLWNQEAKTSSQQCPGHLREGEEEERSSSDCTAQIYSAQLRKRHIGHSGLTGVDGEKGCR
jgi:hypothetical protein